MKMKKLVFNTLRLIPIMAVIGLAFVGCKKETTIDKALASCEGCHTNYAHLQEVYSPDTAAAVGGCGGDAPHYEPYDRVVMKGEGYEAYKASGHYALGCVYCHNGVGNTANKDDAHSGDFLAHPSDNYTEKCGGCHAEIAQNFQTSLHNGTGQKRKVTIRGGLNGHEDFNQLPQHQIEGYNSNCKHCHGTCGKACCCRRWIGPGT